jgi:general secretion pathway protein D
MNRLLYLLCILCSFPFLLLGQGTTTIQTPFGPKEVPAPAGQPAAVPAPPGQPPTTAAPPTVVQQAPPAQNPPTPNADAQQARQPGALPQDDAASPVQLNLLNQDVRQVIQIIGASLGLNYIIDPAIKGTVDISTSETLRRSDLLPILETILKINGATMIKTGNFYQIVPSNSAAKQPIEVIDQQRQAIAPDDQVVMQIVRMKFVAASEMGRILTQLLSDAGSIIVHETGNIILLTDRRSNIRKLLGIVDEFDTAVFQGERVRLLPVKNNRARDLVDDLRTIFTGYGMSDKQSAIRLIVIDRLNSILVVTPNSDVFPEVERWLTTLDQPSASAGIHNFVYKVKNAKAADLQKVLSQLYGLQVQSANTGLIPNPAFAQPLAGGNSAIQAVPGAVPGAVLGAVPPQSPQTGQSPLQPIAVAASSPTTALRIIADELNNALVIQASPQEFAEIERTLNELDVLRRQVLVDAQVYEIALDDSLAFGVTAALQNRGTLANPQTTASFSAGTGGGAPALAAQTFAFIGRTRELVMFLNASENRSRVKTLSAPSVLVSDNGTAQFEVGTQVPIPTSSSISPVQSGGTNLFAQTISYQQTGVILQVRPQINESGNVTMDISQEISSAGANTVSAIVAPVIGKSAVTSSVIVQDGQTIAIGGFIRENTDLERNRIPLVGRIPVMGVLFGNTSNSKTRTELIVLITPHVLRTHGDADLATDELKTKLKEIRSLLK